ncbi:MAG: hypothetical protein N2691_03720 [Patescibacteria group bacterium]|nr:hypothetical protein [Patescibacteria group bacterium]
MIEHLRRHGSVPAEAQRLMEILHAAKTGPIPDTPRAKAQTMLTAYRGFLELVTATIEKGKQQALIQAFGHTWHHAHTIAELLDKLLG